MFFKSNEKFLQDIAESFERFGIKEESSENGAVKDTVRIHMVDTIHDSSYIAIAKSKSEKNNAEKVWNNIIEKDFIPAGLDPKNKGDIPAAAMIVPEEDIDIVEKILKSKDLRPTVYQIFPGYVVAGLKRADVGKLIEDYQNIKPDSDEKPEEDKSASQRTGNDLSVENGHLAPQDETPQDIAEIGRNDREPGKNFSLASKVAAAALLGVGAGLVPFAAKTFMDKNKDVPPQSLSKAEVSAQSQRPSINAEKYFQTLKEGSPADMEALKSIASNPSLSKEYIEKLANSPVGIEVIKNPSADAYIPLRAAASDDEDKRAAAAENPRTRPEDLYRLSFDKSPKVRQSLAKNPAISMDTMQKLASDEPEIRRALLENTSLTPDILEKIEKNTRPDCDFVRKMMANPCITPDILRRNSVNADECMRAGVASNPNTPPEILEDLGNDKNPDIMAGAYKNPGMSERKLNSLFPENWTKSKASSADKALRKAALENPKIKPNIMEEALASDPIEYSGNLAKNPSIPSGIADEINTVAQGRKGLRNFMKDASKLKNDKNFHDEMKKESEKYGGDVSVPLRKKLNADFASAVYDPARIASIINSRNLRMPVIVSSSVDKPRSPQNSGGDKISSLDKRGNAPIFFSKKNDPVSSGSFGGGDPSFSEDGSAGDKGSEKEDKGEEALKAADDIVSGLMSDILPFVAKSVYGSPKLPKKLADAYGGGSGSPWRAMDTSKDTIFNPGEPMDIMFKNACDRVDSLQVLF